MTIICPCNDNSKITVEFSYFDFVVSFDQEEMEVRFEFQKCKNHFGFWLIQIQTKSDAEMIFYDHFRHLFLP